MMEIRDTSRVTKKAMGRNRPRVLVGMGYRSRGGT